MTFPITISLWDYTHIVVSYLCGKYGVNGTASPDDEWLDYFDAVITGSAKMQPSNSKQQCFIMKPCKNGRS